MSTTRGVLNSIRDELDAIQIPVELREFNGEIMIIANNEADRLIAQQEVRKRGFKVSALHIVRND